MCKIMWYLALLLILGLFDSSNTESLSDLNDDLAKYFEEPYKSFQSKWVKFKTALENSAESAMKTMNGERRMNVYIKRTDSPIKLTGGFYVTDNIVALLLSDLKLRLLPYIEMPDVKIALAGNAVRFEGDLTKMFIDSDYLLFRNKSDILYSGAPQNPYEYSPFSFQQVDFSGSLTIVAEGCTLTGIAIAKLNGQKVSFGHDTLHVRGCRFTIEISTPGSGQPPVIAPYFSERQRNQLERFLTHPVKFEVYPRLQGAIFSILNTTALFGSDERMLQVDQTNIMSETADYVNELIRKMNLITIQKNSGTIPIKGLAIVWEQLVNGKVERNSLIIDGVTLSNLDSIYSGNRGGPYKLMTRKIAEELRFSSLQVRGRIRVQNLTHNIAYELGAELLDVGVDMLIDLEGKHKETAMFEFCGWRALGYSSQDLLYLINGDLLPDLLIKAYLNSLLPEIIQKYLEDIFGEAEKYRAPSSGEDNKNNNDLEKCIQMVKDAGIPVGDEVNNIAKLSEKKQEHGFNDYLNKKYIISGLEFDEASDNKLLLTKTQQSKKHKIQDDVFHNKDFAITGLSNENGYKVIADGVLKTDKGNEPERNMLL